MTPFFRVLRTSENLPNLLSHVSIENTKYNVIIMYKRNLWITWKIYVHKIVKGPVTKWERIRKSFSSETHSMNRYPYFTTDTKMLNNGYDTFRFLYMNPFVCWRWSRRRPGVATNKFTPFTIRSASPLLAAPPITKPSVCEWYLRRFFATAWVWSM